MEQIKWEAMPLADILKTNPEAIYLVDPKHQDYKKLCLQVISIDIKNFQYIQHPTEEICMEAIQNYQFIVLKYIRKQTDEICLAAVRLLAKATNLAARRLKKMD